MLVAARYIAIRPEVRPQRAHPTEVLQDRQGVLVSPQDRQFGHAHTATLAGLRESDSSS